jgi:hypothetical protein
MTTYQTQPSSRLDRALVVAACVVGASGLFFVLFGTTTASLFKRLIYGSATNPVTGTEALEYTRFVYGVLGAVMIGWAIALLFVIHGPLRRRERWSWNAVAASMGGWFAVDTSLSIWSGYAENAVLNLGFAILFTVPLVAIHREFPKAH